MLNGAFETGARSHEQRTPPPRLEPPLTSRSSLTFTSRPRSLSRSLLLLTTTISSLGTTHPRYIRRHLLLAVSSKHIASQPEGEQFGGLSGCWHKRRQSWRGPAGGFLSEGLLQRIALFEGIILPLRLVSPLLCSGPIFNLPLAVIVQPQNHPSTSQGLVALHGKRRRRVSYPLHHLHKRATCSSQHILTVRAA